MNVDEFHAWMESEPDSYELLDGEPIRMADEKQGGRRMGNLFRAADLSLGSLESLEWVRTPRPELGGAQPFLYVAQSWSHLSAALQLLHDPEDGRHRMGDRFTDIRDRVERLAAVERQRTQSACHGR
jgi:hypothetical protein